MFDSSYTENKDIGNRMRSYLKCIRLEGALGWRKKQG